MRSSVTEATSQPVRNHSLRPFPRNVNTPSISPLLFFSSSSSVGVLSDVNGPDGQEGVRLTRVDTAALALYTARHAEASLWRTNKGNFRDGDIWTVLFDCRANREQPITLSIGTGNSSATLGGLSQGFVATTELQTFKQTVKFTQAHVDVNGNAFLKWNPTNQATAPGGMVGDWIEIYNICVVRGLYLGPQVNGDSPGGRWDGERNASMSVAYVPSPQKIRNLCTGPRGTRSAPADYTGTKTLGVSVPHAPGDTVTATRVTYPDATNQPGVNFALGSDGQGVLPANTVITLSCWMYRESGDVNGVYGIALPQQGAMTGVIVPLLTWTRLSWTTTVGAVSRRAGVRGSGTIAGSFLVTNMMITLGATLHEYADGGTPGWQYEGVAGASVSTGYPYTLESVLGGRKLLFDTEATGTVPVTPLPWTPGLNQPWTTFVTYEHSAHTVNSTPQFLIIGEAIMEGDSRTNTTSTIRLNAGANPSGVGAIMRRSGGNGPARTVGSLGRHTVWGGLNSLGRQWIATDVNASRTSESSLMNQTPTHVQLFNPAYGVLPLRRIVVAGEIPDSDTVKVERWLANKYGLAA